MSGPLQSLYWCVGHVMGRLNATEKASQRISSRVRSVATVVSNHDNTNEK